MSRKIDIESINLKVDGVELFELDGEKASLLNGVPISALVNTPL